MLLFYPIKYGIYIIPESFTPWAMISSTENKEMPQYTVDELLWHSPEIDVLNVFYGD